MNLESDLVRQGMQPDRFGNPANALPIQWLRQVIN